MGAGGDRWCTGAAKTVRSFGWKRKNFVPKTELFCIGSRFGWCTHVCTHVYTHARFGGECWGDSLRGTRYYLLSRHTLTNYYMLILMASSMYAALEREGGSLWHGGLSIGRRRNIVIAHMHTLYALKSRYSSRGFASIGSPLTNNVRTCNRERTCM